jgi:hypothetical protein
MPQPYSAFIAASLSHARCEQPSEACSVDLPHGLRGREVPAAIEAALRHDGQLPEGWTAQVTGVEFGDAPVPYLRASYRLVRRATGARQ